MILRLFFLLLTLATFGFAKNIDVQSGDFAYFGMSLPSVNVAGEAGKITLGAFDAFGNKTNYFGGKERTFTLKVSGSATLDKTTFTPADFASGSVTVSVLNRVAETVSVSLYEGPSLLLAKNMAAGTFVPGFTLKFDHAPLGSFDISVPGKVIAGEEFNVILTARDKAGNILTGYSSIADGVMLSAEGDKGKKNLLVPSHRFIDGRAEVAMRYDFGGTVRISATDMGNEWAKGSAGPLNVEAQRLARIEVNAPSSIRAGVPFTVELRAISQLGNVMKNYSAVGEDILLKTNGRGELIPDRVSASAFVHGVARFETLYTVPEPIVITAEPSKTPMVKPEIAFDAPSKRAAVQSAEAAQTPKNKNTFPLSFRFDSSLGDIQRIESDYLPQGKLGITRIYVRFENAKKVKNVQPVTKDITVEGRVIGLLSVNGSFDRHGRLKVEIIEKEPFAVEVKNSRKSLNLLFLLDN
ncbi:MAG: hypothetical protein PHV10_07985 [Sulfuricurvum sp.]|nr:hypothetical protein [Sulfuricurvum sp.]